MTVTYPNPALQDAHLFHSAGGNHLFLTDGSRIYDLPSDWAAPFREDPLDVHTWVQLGLMAPERRYIDPQETLEPPPLTSLSLNVAQACNLACRYCYADRGHFGGTARRMSRETAQAAVDRLIAESAPYSDLVLGYMGGEPLLNREVVQATTEYAAAAARSAGRRIRFALTTNATLLQPEDARLFATFPFTVTVSIDGDAALQDTLRPLKDGRGSYGMLRQGLDCLQRWGRPRHLAARATVTPSSGALKPILEHLIGLGFDDVGFSPVVASPDPTLEFTAADFEQFLAAMIECGQTALAELMAGRPYPFSNLETALHELHRGSHRPYPCGAGAGYLSVNADGALFACHRLIDDPQFAMGDVRTGSDRPRRQAHLLTHRVEQMEPCRQCWARYLCGGGCYHEVARRGRLGCDYIRGWLSFCLQAYVELSAQRPDYFAAAPVDPASRPPILVAS